MKNKEKTFLLPKDILVSKEMSRPAKLLYFHLFNKAGRVSSFQYQTIGDLAVKLNMSPRSIKIAKAELKALNLVSVDEDNNIHLSMPDGKELTTELRTSEEFLNYKLFSIFPSILYDDEMTMSDKITYMALSAFLYNYNTTEKKFKLSVKHVHFSGVATMMDINPNTFKSACQKLKELGRIDYKAVVGKSLTATIIGFKMYNKPTAITNIQDAEDDKETQSIKIEKIVKKETKEQKRQEQLINTVEAEFDALPYKFQQELIDDIETVGYNINDATDYECFKAQLNYIQSRAKSWEEAEAVNAKLPKEAREAMEQYIDEAKKILSEIEVYNMSQDFVRKAAFIPLQDKYDIARKYIEAKKAREQKAENVDVSYKKEPKKEAKEPDLNTPEGRDEFFAFLEENNL